MRTFLKKLAATFLLSTILITGSGIATYAVSVDTLLPSTTTTNDPHLDTLLQNYENLPNQTDAQNEYYAITNTAIRLMLYVSSGLVVIGLFVAAVLYMTGSMNEENINKAKKIFGYLAIGILIMSVAYAIVTGITQIDLFDTP
jgi:hypothetical protein